MKISLNGRVWESTNITREQALDFLIGTCGERHEKVGLYALISDEGGIIESGRITDIEAQTDALPLFKAKVTVNKKYENRGTPCYTA